MGIQSRGQMSGPRIGMMACTMANEGLNHIGIGSVVWRSE